MCWTLAFGSFFPKVDFYIFRLFSWGSFLHTKKNIVKYSKFDILLIKKKFLAEICVFYQYLLISWMKKLKFGKFFIINRTLSNFASHWKKFRVQKVSKYNKIYVHNFLFQEIVNIPLNCLDTKLVTMDERYHKKYIRSEWCFLNKTVHLLS